MRILLAEDSRTSQQLAMLILEDEGHSVEVADNGLIAVEKFANSNSSFDLILMDVQMPEMDGLERQPEFGNTSNQSIHEPSLSR